MGYKAQSKLRIDLGELGDNNSTPFYVEIKNPRIMTFDEKMQFAKVAKIDNEDERIGAMKKVVRGLIKSWNLIDVETEQPVDVTQENALDRVPSEVVERIMSSLKPEQTEETKNS